MLACATLALTAWGVVRPGSVRAQGASHRPYACSWTAQGAWSAERVAQAGREVCGAFARVGVDVIERTPEASAGADARFVVRLQQMGDKLALGLSYESPAGAPPQVARSLLLAAIEDVRPAALPLVEALLSNRPVAPGVETGVAPRAGTERSVTERKDDTGGDVRAVPHESDAPVVIRRYVVPPPVILYRPYRPWWGPRYHYHPGRWRRAPRRHWHRPRPHRRQPHRHRSPRGRIRIF